jgi:hypothetical protein
MVGVQISEVGVGKGNNNMVIMQKFFRSYFVGDIHI